MAEVALQVLVATAISAAVSYVLAPDGQDQSGQRLSTLEIQAATEGVPKKRVYGRMRVAGNIVQMPTGELTETVHKDTEGETFFSSGTTITTYYYSANMLTGICDGPVALNAIWADSKRIYANYGEQTALQLQQIDSSKYAGII